MRLSQYPQVLRYALILHETLRRLDFTSEQIFMEPALNEERVTTMFVLLKAQDKEFRAIAGPVPGGDEGVDKLGEQWAELVIRYNRGEFPEAEVERLYREYWHRAQGGKPGFCMALVAKGFKLPSLRGKMN